MSEIYSDIYMVDPVLVDDNFDISGELSDNSRQKIKYVLEETLSQMGISANNVLFCPREAGVVDNYVESMSSALQDMSERIADRQTAGVYEEDPAEKDRDFAEVVELKASISDPKPDWEFVGIDSFVKFSGMDNPVDEGAFNGSFGVYDATKLRDKLSSIGTVSASAEEIEEAKLFDFYPRYMEKIDLAAWVFRRVFKETLIHQEAVLDEKIPDNSTGPEIMDWVGRKAQAHGKVTSQIELLEHLEKYGISVPLN